MATTKSLSEAGLVSGETPYELVQRRRIEGASAEVLQSELVALGLDRADIGLLLGQEVRASPTERPQVSEAEGTPWALVQKLRGEGFPPDAIARELASRGHVPEDIKAILADESTRGGPAPVPNGSGMAAAQLVFGILLVVCGGLLMLGGRISVMSVLLVIAGLARIGSSFGAGQRTEAQQAEARRQMAKLSPEDPRARCAVHQEYASIGSCPRCGSFCCAMCTPARGFLGHVCMRCQELPEVRAERQRQASRTAALTLLAAPAMIILIAALEAVSSLSSVDPWGALAFVVIGSVPWLVLSALQAVVRNSWPTLVSALPWLAFAVWMAVGNATLQAGLWLLPLGVGLYGWANLRQAAQIEGALVPQLARPMKESETSSSA